MSEGRRAFFARVAGIEAGVECDRLAPLLSALADGEAGADDLAVLRPHLKTCLSCRARLREYRDAPTRVAALVPPALVVASGGDSPGAVRSMFESIVGATQDKAAALGERAHAAAELATGQKLAAVAASAAAIAGGGAGVEHLASERGEQRSEPVAHAKPVAEPPAQEVGEAPLPEPPPSPEPVAAPEPEALPPDPADEFAPGPAATSAAAAADAPSSSLSLGGATPSASGGGEFGP